MYVQDSISHHVIKINQSLVTSSEGLLPVFVTVALTVTFCPALMVGGMIFRLEYLKMAYELQMIMK